MNLALPAVIVTLALLPGAVFLNTYLSSRFSKRVFGIGPLSEIGTIFVFAIPIDVGALWLCKHWFPIPDTMPALFSMLAGQNTKDSADLVAKAFGGRWPLYGILYIALIVLAMGMGILLRRIVWALRLDTRFTVLRIRHAWFYTLFGRQANRSPYAWPILDVLVNNPEGSRLYRGWLEEFELDESGCVRELTLFYAKRWSRTLQPGLEPKLEPKTAGKGGAPSEWITIPGDAFILIGKNILSINVTYVEPEAAATPWEETRRSRQAIWRAFLTQDAALKWPEKDDEGKESFD